MSRQLKATLDGSEYTIPALNIDQLESVATIITGPARAAGLDILKVAMKRATPAPEWETFAPTFDEIGAVVQKVMEMSGLQSSANPPQAAA